MDSSETQKIIGKLAQAARAFLVSGFGRAEDRSAAQDGLAMLRQAIEKERQE